MLQAVIVMSAKQPHLKPAMPLTPEACPSCASDLSWESEHCPGCGHSVGAPNIREVLAERKALQARYQNTVAANQQRGLNAITADFEAEVAQHSKAVINMSPDILAAFLQDGRKLYSGYALQTAAETRRAANPINDRERLGTEGTLFGSYGPHIRYAALALEGVGLVSYGSCGIELRDTLCENKATVLEENSYTFVRHHRLLPGDQVPEGRRSIWRERSWLATAKLAAAFDGSTASTGFARLLLKSDGDRATDEFLEVHVFGAFSRSAFVAATLPQPGSATDRKSQFHLAESQDHLKQLNIPCTLV